jgi:GT2 family glycosyltransferase
MTTRLLARSVAPKLTRDDLPFVSVIIVNFNGKRFLADCLDSLATQTYPLARFEIILVDNGSADDSVDFVQSHYPSVRVHATGVNLGFAGGNNAGFLAARGELLALLNNDTVVEPRWLEALVAAMTQGDRIGAVASKILLKHDPSRINSVGLDLYRTGWGADRGYLQVDEGQFDEPAEVFGACGASVLLSRAMLDDIGLFDERFFMYYEDLDLAWRARRRGWSIRYTPASVVYHVHCGSSGEASPFFVYHVERNRAFVHLKNAPLATACRVLASFAWRTLRKSWLVATLRERDKVHRGQALAMVRAAVSLVGRLPEMLWKRWRVRWRNGATSDRELARFTIAPPQ